MDGLILLIRSESRASWADSDSSARAKENHRKTKRSAKFKISAPLLMIYFFEFFKDALINSLNKGWGLLGLDLNSGWNWQPSSRGWSLSPTFPTNSWPGGGPLTTRPAPKILSLYNLLNPTPPWYRGCQ